MNVWRPERFSSSYNTSMNNAIDFSAVTTNVIFKVKGSLVAVLKKAYSDVVTVKYSRHMTQHFLCKTKNVYIIEKYTEKCVAHFNSSYKRQKNIREIEIIWGSLAHKFLCLLQTRWLFMESLVNWFLQQLHFRTLLKTNVMY